MKFLFTSLFTLFSTLFFAQNSIVLGSGTSSGTSVPFAFWYNSAATESIYTGTEIGTTGMITKIGYQKASGNSTIEPSIKIYMKMTSATTTGGTPYSLGTQTSSNYTLVHQGNLPNSSTSGVMEITLDTPFAFSDISQNLSILIVGSTCIPSGRPQFRYTSFQTRMSSTYNDGTIGCDGNNPWNFESTFSPSIERPNIVLTLAALSAEDFTKKNNGISIIAQNHSLEIRSKNKLIAEVELFDLTGRKLAFVQKNTANLILNLEYPNQVVIVKIKTEDQQVITKKIIL